MHCDLATRGESQSHVMRCAVPHDWSSRDQIRSTELRVDVFHTSFIIPLFTLFHPCPAPTTTTAYSVAYPLVGTRAENRVQPGAIQVSRSISIIPD